MSSDLAYARGMLVAARQMYDAQVEHLPLDEALFSAGGWRSSLGVLKHITAWLHIYHSYAFEPEPKHWDGTDWPRGLIDEVELSGEYLQEVIDWGREGFAEWEAALAGLEDGALDQPRRAHFGGRLPLGTLLGIQMFHVVYHAGELNMLLSIKRGEAWEWGEEVEENHIDTFGHGLRGNWMDDATASAVEGRLRAAHERRQAGRN